MGVGWYTLISSKKDCDNAPSTASNENIIHIIWCMGSDSMFIDLLCPIMLLHHHIYIYLYSPLLTLSNQLLFVWYYILLCQWIVYKNHGWIMDAQCIYLMNQCSFFQICGGWCLVGVGCGPFKMYHPKSELGVPRTKLELAHGAILQSWVKLELVAWEKYKS